MKIAVVGAGHAGLVAGTCFTGVGIDAGCVDVDDKTLDALRRGKVRFFGPHLARIHPHPSESSRPSRSGQPQRVVSSPTQPT